MPLTEEQKAAVETLKGVSTEDIEEAAEALKSSAQPIYQKIFRGGHSTATTAAKTEKATLEGQLTAEKERATGLETELNELKAKTPDRAQIDAQWQQKLDREKKALQDQLDASNSKIGRLTTDTKVEKIEIALLGANFRPKMAKLLAKEHSGRIDFDANGQPILKEAGSDIPIPIPAGKTAFQLLAEQEKSTADPADLVSNADTGGGCRGGGGGAAKSVDELVAEKRASGDYGM
jgi:hypothetical protein